YWRASDLDGPRRPHARHRGHPRFDLRARALPPAGSAHPSIVPAESRRQRTREPGKASPPLVRVRRFARCADDLAKPEPPLRVALAPDVPDRVPIRSAGFLWQRPALVSYRVRDTPRPYRRRRSARGFDKALRGNPTEAQALAVSLAGIGARGYEECRKIASTRDANRHAARSDLLISCN